ncbi:MAG TPA: translocation/assembly module TamB domain-containing protein, partial [Terriglobales bacterium]|nr:translocation/assembly module TamB domain-containing protein [Terriglobales bacterium]
ASRSLNFDQLQLTMPSSHLEARGSIGGAGAALHVTLGTTNFPELQSALSDLSINFTVPAEIHGSLNFTGEVSGTREEPQLSGHVVATDVDYLAEFTAEGLLRASAPPTPAAVQRIHWDRIVADLQYSAQSVALRNATLQNGAARISLSGSAALSGGHVVPSSRIDLQASVQNEDARRVALLIGTPFSTPGLVSGSVRLSGTASNPAGNGSFRITNLPLGKQPGTASASFTIRTHEAQFTNLELGRGATRISGLATLNLLTDAFTFNVRSGAIDLASLPELQNSRITVAGTLTFTAQGSGTAASPEVNAAAHVTNLIINGESLGDLNAKAVTQQGVMQLTAATTAATAQLTIDGSVRLAGDYPATLGIKFPHLDFDPLLSAYLRGRLTGHSLAVGTAQVNGPLKNPRMLKVDASLEQFSVAIEKLSLRNVAPVHFGIANEVLTLDQFHIAGPNTDLTGSGMVALGSGRPMDLRAEGTVDLALVQTIDPNFNSGGKMTLDVRAQGTTARPLLTGRVEVQNAKIAYIDLPNGLSDVNGTLIFDQNRLVVEKLTSQSGGGTLALGGYVAYANGLSFSITAKAQDMRLRYPPGVSSVTNADLRWAGTPNNSLVSGDLTLTRFGMSPKFDFASYLASAARPIAEAGVNSALSNIRLDVHVVSTPALQVSTSLAKVAGDMDLRIRGTLDNPTILGRVNIVRGDIFFNGTTYRVQRGDITFVNPTTIEPVLNLDFTTRIAGYDINLSLDGPLDHLHTTYRSDPPLPSSDIISLLAFRQCPTSAEFTCSPSAVEQAETYNASANPSFTETASNQILGEALNATLSNRVQRLFGISRVKISPEIATAIGNPSARITIEQQVSNNVTITYVTDVAQAQQQVIQVEYNVNRNVSIVAVRDQFGVLSFDVRIRRRKR